MIENKLVREKHSGMQMLSPYLMNKQINEIEFKENMIILQSKPRFLRVILTNLCNINCIMCDIQATKTKFTIPYETINKIFEFFPYLETICWQGGEVFLVDYFKDLLEAASKYPNIRQEIQTNGLLIDEAWAELLAKYNVDLLLSINSVTKATFEHIHQGSKYEDLLKSLSIINKFKEKYNSHLKKVMTVCILRSNFKEIERFVNFAIRYDFQMVTFSPLRGPLVSEENIFSPPDREALLYLKRIMSEIEKKCYENKIYMEYFFKPFIEDKNEISLIDKIHSQTDAMPLLKCKAPWIGLHIDAIRLGEVLPDCMCKKGIGNIIDESILDIWNGLPMQQYRKALIEGNPQIICSEDCIQKLVPDSYFV